MGLINNVTLWSGLKDVVWPQRRGIVVTNSNQRHCRDATAKFSLPDLTFFEILFYELVKCPDDIVINLLCMRPQSGFILVPCTGRAWAGP